MSLNMTTADQPRRSACDRCRGQKLRCERLSSATEDVCRRCLRAGAHCVTTSAVHRLTRGAGVTENHRASTLSSTSSSSLCSAKLESSGILAESDCPTADRHDESESPTQLCLEPQMTTVAPADTVYREQDFDGTFQESSPATTPAQLGNFYQQVPLSEDTMMQPLTVLTNPPNVFSFTPISPYYQGETNPAQHPFNFVPATRSPFNTAPHSPWSSFGPPARPQGAVPSARQLGSWHQRFSGLSSELLRDLNLVESGMITGKNLLTTPACHASTSMPDHPYSAGGHNSPYYSIGRMLQSADDFYCVLQELRGQTMSTKSWPLTMSVGESRSMEELRTSGYTGCDRRMSAVGNTAVTGVEGNGELTGRTVDALLALLIRTCHTTLLRICQAVVSLIRDSLPMAKNRSSFEPVLPVVRLDGFDVGYRQDLQIRILLQVAAHLFDEIDEILRDLKLGDGVSPSLEALLSTNVLGVTLDGACDAPMIKESIASVCKSIHEQLGNGGELR